MSALTWKAWADVPHEQKKKDGPTYTYSESDYVAYKEIVEESAAREHPPKLAAASFRWREQLGRGDNEWPPWGWKPEGYPEPEKKTPDTASEYEQQCVYAGLMLLQSHRGEADWWADARFRAVFDKAPPKIDGAILAGGQQAPTPPDDNDVPF